ncbi:MAG TPA: phenylalanine--tRNA ligase subunit alpha, partial [Planctomycetes bacterium]|nr:phenylalanine--tRNA ligase subunit alpha [Planctomycetota bacterium]
MASHEVQSIQDEALAEIRRAEDTAALAAVSRAYLGKEGRVGELLASIPKAPPEERRGIGQAANQLKRAIEAALDERRAELEAAALEAERVGDGFDPTLPAAPVRRGSLHPITQVTRELEDIFTSMGYRILDGPDVELEAYNFEALNIPADHPAREMYDTFWCSSASAPDRENAPERLLMRTHTSPVQIRALERIEPPFRAIAPGRCFRNETVDASHEHTFHQMEGLVVGEGITVGHLI